MIEKVIFFIVAIALCFGCSNPKGTNNVKETLSSETESGISRGQGVEKSYYEIPYDGKVYSIGVNDLFKDIKYVRLETNKASLLNDNIDKIESKNGVIYIGCTKSSGLEAILFDGKGKFLRYINKRGKDAEKYATGVDIAVNDKGHVSFADRANRVLTYTSEGNFVSRIELPDFALKDLAYLNDTILVLRSDMFRAGKRFHLLNMNTKKIMKSLYQKEYTHDHMWFTETLTARHGKVLASGYQSNNIVEITQDTAVVKYTLNIGNKMPPADFWKTQTSQEETGKEEYSHGYIGHIPFFAESDRYMFFRFMGNLGSDLRGQALVDKATGESRTFKRIILAEKVVISPYRFYWLSNGQIVIPIWPDKIMKSENKEFLKQFPNLKEDDNPILLFGELK